MERATASSLAEVNELLSSGKYKTVVMNFNLSADEFFVLATYWGDRGAKFKRTGGNFVVRLGKNARLTVDE